MPVVAGESGSARAVHPGHNHPYWTMTHRSRRSRLAPTASNQASKEDHMWRGIGFGGFVLYLLLLFFVGIRALSNGHGWMFFFGIFFTILWVMGAFMQPASPQAA
jgi:hypothetical protein